MERPGKDNLAMPWQSISIDVLKEKYAKGEEKELPENQIVTAIYNRVAIALANNEDNPDNFKKDFVNALDNGFIPAGRIASTAGTDISNSTLINCFVQPVGDSISQEINGKPGIYTALQQAAETMRRGGGVGYNFSDIRPMGAEVKGTASAASGPVSYMHVFDQSCSTVESAGSRRGAQMGVLNIDHPDILDFISAKQTSGKLNNFNISVGVTDEFMKSLEDGDSFQLTHNARPIQSVIDEGAYQREDGKWVYDTVNPRELWDKIMRNTYNAAEPGVLFLDQINRENNLHYCELIEATNPCGEQPLSNYSACCLGSIDLTRFVVFPFSDHSAFDYEAFANVVRPAIRMLDNVLDITAWPLPEQHDEAMAKRRVGLGFTGLGDTLIELGIKYDSEDGRYFASKVSKVMRDTAYRTSIEIAKEKGSFPVFDRDKYLGSGFAKRLPVDIIEGIRQHGIRNSHLVSIAPTGTISLAFADNCSNGIEPPFSWFYTRKKRIENNETIEYKVEDHAYRLFRHLGGDVDNLPSEFRSALDISASDHMLMQAAVQPFIDTSISKTVNVPADYPFDKFKNLYTDAWRSNLKGTTTYRPNDVIGSVLSLNNEQKADDPNDPDRKLHISKTPQVALASLRWPKRPFIAEGTPGITYMIKTGMNSFALFVGHIANGSDQPFEVWVNGEETPRGLGALAKNLSMDMRAYDREWLKMKLSSLSRTPGTPFTMTMPSGKDTPVSGNVAAVANLITHRCTELDWFNDDKHDAPLIDAMFSKKEPKSDTEGTLSWTVDVKNVNTGDDFALFVKECVLPDGTHRPYSVWLSGVYPRDFDGLAKSLSLDMRVLDTAWIAKKLRNLKDMPEAQGDFFAKVPGKNKQSMQPSTVAYIARLLIHRYNMLGLLNEDGYPIKTMGYMEEIEENAKETEPSTKVMPGKVCPECGNAAVIKRDGCSFCTACGAVGACS